MRSSVRIEMLGTHESPCLGMAAAEADDLDAEKVCERVATARAHRGPFTKMSYSGLAVPQYLDGSATPWSGSNSMEGTAWLVRLRDGSARTTT